MEDSGSCEVLSLSPQTFHRSCPQGSRRVPRALLIYISLTSDLHVFRSWPFLGNPRTANSQDAEPFLRACFFTTALTRMPPKILASHTCARVHVHTRAHTQSLTPPFAPLQSMHARVQSVPGLCICENGSPGHPPLYSLCSCEFLTWPTPVVKRLHIRFCLRPNPNLNPESLVHFTHTVSNA